MGLKRVRRAHTGKPLSEILPALSVADIDPDNYSQSGGHPLYHPWAMANRRCADPRHHHYPTYGGRGITFHRPWAFDFEAFARYVADHLGPRPAGSSLDRIDNDRGYEPGNLKWSTQTEQIRNRSNTRWVEFRGSRMTLSEFCRMAEESIGVLPATMKERLRRGCSPESAWVAVKNRRLPIVKS